MELRQERIEQNVSNQPDKTKVMGLKWNKNSWWRLKHDVKRVILYESHEDGMVINQAGFLTPSEAIILALFDGKRTIEEVIKAAAEAFEETPENSEKNVKTILSKWSNALEEKGENMFTPQYNPIDFVIPAWQVDNVSWRFFKPATLQFRVSDSCMRKCIYCNIETKPREKFNLISLERWDQLAEETKELEIHAVILSGGDPFMYKGFIEVVKCFTKRGIHPFISTKSLVSKGTARALSEAGIKIMQVSIDAPNKEVADFLTHSNGAFEQTVQSIKNLIEAGIKVTTNTVVTSYNVLLIPSLVYFLNDLGVRKVKLAQYVRSYYAEYDVSLFVSERAGEWLENEINKIANDKSADIDVTFDYLKDFSAIDPKKKKEIFERRSLCTASRWGFVITGTGKVIPCDEIPVKDEYILGDVNSQSILEVWNSPANTKYTTPPREPFKGTICYDCEDFEECHRGKGRCFRDALKAYGSIYAPAPICWKAPKGLRLS